MPRISFRLRPEGAARARLICFPYAGGAALAFRDWRFTSDIETCGVELPGRGRSFNEPLLESVHVAAKSVADEIPTDLPFGFYGHSLGAIVAYETTLELRRRGGPLPVLLAVGASRAPHVADPMRKLARLPEAELIAELQKYGGTPAEVLANREFLDLVLPILRADFAMAEEYESREEQPLAVPLRSFSGSTDQTVAAEAVASWSAVSEQAKPPITLPGGHFFLRESGSELRAALAHDLLSQLR